MALEQDQRIGDRYVLMTRLGSGRDGRRLVAPTTRMLERRVALKFLHERFAQDEQFVERFRREASSPRRACSTRTSSASTTAASSTAAHFIAMEYVEGASLKDLIDARAHDAARRSRSSARCSRAQSSRTRTGSSTATSSRRTSSSTREGRARVDRLRYRPRRRLGDHPDRLGARHRAVPVPGAGPGSARHRRIGHLLGRRDALRDAHRPACRSRPTRRSPSPSSRSPSSRARRAEINPEVTPALDAVVLRSLAKDPAIRFQTADEFRAALDVAELDPTAPTALAATAAAAIDELDIDALIAEDDARRRRNRRIALSVLIALLIVGGVLAFLLSRTDHVNVPHVVDQQLGQAQAELEGEGFRVSTSRVESCDTVGTVTEQQPPAGSRADEGSLVVLTVSKGQQVTIPALKNKTADDATKEAPGRQPGAGRRDGLSAVRQRRRGERHQYDPGRGHGCRLQRDRDTPHLQGRQHDRRTERDRRATRHRRLGPA